MSILVIVTDPLLPPPIHPMIITETHITEEMIGETCTMAEEQEAEVEGGESMGMGDRGSMEWVEEGEAEENMEEEGEENMVEGIMVEEGEVVEITEEVTTDVQITETITHLLAILPTLHLLHLLPLVTTLVDPTVADPPHVIAITDVKDHVNTHVSIKPLRLPEIPIQEETTDTNKGLEEDKDMTQEGGRG